MKKWVVLILLILSTAIIAQTDGRQIFSFSKFTGLNLATDGVNLNPSQAVMLENMRLDKYGVLHKRYPFYNWNDNLITGGVIKDFHYLDKRNGEKFLFVATDSVVYEVPGWEDTVTVWAGMEIDYDVGHIDTSYLSTDQVWGVDTWWIGSISPGDIFIADDYLGAEQIYTVDSIYSDTKLKMVENIAIHDTTTTYRIIKRVSNQPRLTSFNGSLIVCDGVHQAWTYPDSLPLLLAVVDSGTVTGAVGTIDDMAPWTDDTFRFFFNGSNMSVSAPLKTKLLTGTFIDGSLAADTGNYFEMDFYTNNQGIHTTFRAEIIGLYAWSNDPDSIWSMTLSKAYRNESFYPIIEGDIGNFMYVENGGNLQMSWHIRSRQQQIGWQDEQYIEDSTKYWASGEYRGAVMIAGSDAKKLSIISENETNRLYIDSTTDIGVGDKYYIMWTAPTVDSVIYSNPALPTAGRTHYWTYRIYSDIIFYKNRMYAIGFEVVKEDMYWGQYSLYSEADTVNTGRVWFSDIGRPGNVPALWNFDLGGASNSQTKSLYSEDEAQRFFVLGNALYCITKGNIYRITGEPSNGPATLTVAQIISGLGTNQPDGIITTKENLAYIMNSEGVWKFNGTTVQKISLLVDPLTERYREASMVAGYWDDDLWFSYPESLKTLVYHQPSGQWTGPYDVGMTLINNQNVANDSGYIMLSLYTSDNGYLHKYPGSKTVFVDYIQPGIDSSSVDPYYRSGWFSTGVSNTVVGDRISISLNKGVGPFYALIYTDFDTSTIVDTISLGGSADNKVWRRKLNKYVKGDYLQIALRPTLDYAASKGTIHKDSTTDITLREVAIECYKQAPRH